MTEEKKRKQISFNVSPEFHKRIKTQATLQGISMTTYIVRQIYRSLRDIEIEAPAE